MGPNVRGVCRECDQLTSGRCWRHASSTYIAGTVQIIPVKIEVIPIILPADPTTPEVL